MIEADRVLSTPPLSTPIDPNRRRFLAVAAGASVASVGTLAAAAMPATAPDSAACADPIFAVIERHRELSARYSAAADISGNMTSDHPDYAAAEAVTEECCDALLDHAEDELISLLPTTLAGVIALARYMAAIPEWQQPRDHFTWEIDGATSRWHQILLHTLADGIEMIGREG